MRVAIDYTAAVNQSDGIGRFVKNQIEALLHLDHETDYTLVYAAENAGRQRPTVGAPNVRTCRLPLRERALNVLWHRLRLPVPITLSTGTVDLVHAPNFVLPPVGNAATVVTVHDVAFLTQPDCADARLRAYLSHTVPYAVQHADLVLTDSLQTKMDLMEHYAMPADHAEVVYGGVGPAFAPATRATVADVRRTYGLERPYVLAVGVIEPRKNLPRLIDAFGQFQSRVGPTHDLVIAGGRGWLSDATFAQAAASSVRDQIRFTGFVPDTLLPALYTGAEVFAYASLYEGFGLPVLEAMACGAPVICSDRSSLPEFATGAAEMVATDDTDALATALERLCGDTELRSQRQAQGLARAAEFTWDRSARALLAAYQVALARRRDARN